MTGFKIEQAETDLERDVEQIINSNLEELDSEDQVEHWFQNLAENGCVSGMIPELIYYDDTIAFYERHKSEINNLVSDMCNETGSQPLELFNQSMVDRSDPLFTDTTNQNLLAWFAFEEVARRLAQQAGYEM